MREVIRFEYSRLFSKNMREGKEVTKIQELVYELKTEDAMTDHLISICPETQMAELRTILRENKISGTPVVQDGRLVGIISIEDFINWLADDGKTCPVKDRMTSRVETVYTDDPLIKVVGKLDRFGFGRLPVVDRSSGLLKGIITKGDIIERLLHKLQIEYQEEEIHRYRASHLFEDIIADSVSLHLDYEIGERKIEKGGTVASSLKKTLRRLGIHPDIIRRASILTYEAEMNVIIYAYYGEVNVTVSPNCLHMTIRDKGPGIPDIEKAIQPGYSTAPSWVQELGFGAGMGLHNIKSCADELEVTSTVGEGTTLKVQVEVGDTCI